MPAGQHVAPHQLGDLIFVRLHERIVHGSSAMEARSAQGGQKSHVGPQGLYVPYLGGRGRVVVGFIEDHPFGFS